MKIQKRYLISALCILTSALLHAQGILPPGPGYKTSREVVVSTKTYLLVGDAVATDLSVVDGAGKVRALLSYKASLEVLVVGFYSPECSYDQALWRDLQLFYQAYKDWHVAFVAVSSKPSDNLDELAAAMKKAGLPYQAVRDENQKVATQLHVTATPEIVIIDEWGHLRYRGPLHDAPQTPGGKPQHFYARKAIEAVIGHIERVPDPEPGDFIGCPITP